MPVHRLHASATTAREMSNKRVAFKTFSSWRLVHFHGGESRAYIRRHYITSWTMHAEVFTHFYGGRGEREGLLRAALWGSWSRSPWSLWSCCSAGLAGWCHQECPQGRTWDLRSKEYFLKLSLSRATLCGMLWNSISVMNDEGKKRWWQVCVGSGGGKFTTIWPHQEMGTNVFFLFFLPRLLHPCWVYGLFPGCSRLKGNCHSLFLCVAVIG